MNICELFKPVAPAYCDYIAHQIADGLRNADPEHLIGHVGRVKWDLHPEGGYLLSTKKTLDVTDRNGTRYRVTVEEISFAPREEEAVTA